MEENYWWLKKCLVCGECHECMDGSILPCTNYKWDVNKLTDSEDWWDTQHMGIEEFNYLYMGTFYVDEDLVEIPHDIKSSDDFIRWIKGAKDMGDDQGLDYLG